MSTNRTTKKSTGFGLEEDIAKTKSAVCKKEHALTVAEAKQHYDWELETAANTANQHSFPIATEDQQLLAGTLVHNLDDAIAGFVKSMRSQGIKVSLEHLPLKRRDIEMRDQDHALLYDKGDQCPPCILVTFPRDSLVSDTMPDYFLTTPSIGWRITARFGKGEHQFTLYATVGFPFSDKVKSSIITRVLHTTDEMKQYKIISRTVVFFTGNYTKQHYAESIEGVRPWLQDWLSDIR